MNMEIQEELNGLREMLNIHKENLNHLEIQKAEFGPLYLPPHIATSIEEEKNEIQRLTKEIQGLEQPERLKPKIQSEESEIKDSKSKKPLSTLKIICGAILLLLLLLLFEFGLFASKLIFPPPKAGHQIEEEEVLDTIRRIVQSQETGSIKSIEVQKDTIKKVEFYRPNPKVKKTSEKERKCMEGDKFNEAIKESERCLELKPIEAAKITVEGKEESASSDNTGNFIMPTKSITLSPSIFRRVGRVSDGKGSPIDRANIRVEKEGKLIASAESNSKGRFILEFFKSNKNEVEYGILMAAKDNLAGSKLIGIIEIEEEIEITMQPQKINYIKSSITELTEEISVLVELAQTYNSNGETYRAQGNYQEALKWYEQSIKISEKIGDHVDQTGLATTYNNIAYIHYAQGNYQEALKRYEQSIKISEKIGDQADQAGLATTYNNIGAIHYVQGNYQEALKWYERSKEILERIGDWHHLAMSLRNIGLLP